MFCPKFYCRKLIDTFLIQIVSWKLINGPSKTMNWFEFTYFFYWHWHQLIFPFRLNSFIDSFSAQVVAFNMNRSFYYDCHAELDVLFPAIIFCWLATIIQRWKKDLRLFVCSFLVNLAQPIFFSVVDVPSIVETVYYCSKFLQKKQREGKEYLFILYKPFVILSSTSFSAAYLCR